MVGAQANTSKQAGELSTLSTAIIIIINKLYKQINVIFIYGGTYEIHY